jgi:hypothetical protein
MHDNGTTAVGVLGNLLAISIVASYVSKLFLISTLGGKELKAKTLKSTLILFAALLLSWLSSFALL